MRNFKWNRFPIKNLLIDSLLTPIVESPYLNRDMCKFESSQKDESRWQLTDSSKAYRNTSAFNCYLKAFILCIIHQKHQNPHWCYCCDECESNNSDCKASTVMKKSKVLQNKNNMQKLFGNIIHINFKQHKLKSYYILVQDCTRINKCRQNGDLVAFSVNTIFIPTVLL